MTEPRNLIKRLEEEMLPQVKSTLEALNASMETQPEQWTCPGPALVLWQERGKEPLKGPEWVLDRDAGGLQLCLPSLAGATEKGPVLVEQPFDFAAMDKVTPSVSPCHPLEHHSMRPNGGGFSTFSGPVLSKLQGAFGYSVKLRREGRTTKTKKPKYLLENVGRMPAPMKPPVPHQSWPTKPANLGTAIMRLNHMLEFDIVPIKRHLDTVDELKAYKEGLYKKPRLE